MFQLQSANKEVWENQILYYPNNVGFDKTKVEQVLLLRWEEHCVECAMPDCYDSCTLYSRRKDGGCSRFEYGIFPNKNFRGLYNFGADVKFKKWGKIEANLSGAQPAPVVAQNCLKLHYEIFTGVREKNKTVQGDILEFDAFVLECYNPGIEPFNLVLEYFIQSEGRKTKLRHSFVIKIGYNIFHLPYELFNMDQMEGFIYLQPEDCNLERRIIFTWLDFIKYKQSEREERKIHTLSKIKCVAWDLDNTVWQGTLIDTENVTITPDALDLIKRLDSMGIIQTIISKNDHETAWKILSRYKMEEFFLYPAINWGQKSENLIQISDRLRIDLDAFAVIDDSEFERQEIKSKLPQVRVYSEKEIASIPFYPEFMVPVTELSRHRRLSYVNEEQRDAIKDRFSGNYEDFIAACNMQLHLFIPRTDPDIKRCWELIQRTNQLNLSSNRYSFREFETLLESKKFLSIALKVKDRFGDYGTVGFVSINFSEEIPLVSDFILSCRIAQKKVEHAFFKCFSILLLNSGFETLHIRLVLSEKNKPLRRVFNELPFNTENDTGDTKLLSLKLSSLKSLKDIITVQLEDDLLYGFISHFR